MMKLPFALLVASVATLAGCDLYFGDGHNGQGGSNWNYCGSDGYYTCSGDNCEWQGPTCPPGVGGSGTSPGGSSSGSGYECNANTDCAAGCYCAGGKCTEAGFCTQDSDCGNGYHCNTDRSSCEPNTTPPKTTCDYDNQCPSGQYCAPDHTCTATCTCTNDAQAVAGGYGWCDETRSTCLPGQDPAGTCAGEATASCTTGRPACQAGQVAVLIDGCYTGQCRDINACDLAPECTHITDQTNCDLRQDCTEVVNGINCTNGSGQACHDGDVGCTCTQYVYASCAAKPANP